MESVSESFSDIFLGRQPLIDRHQAVIAYELLFRNTAENFSTISSAREATADVVCKAFAELGLATALGKQKAFINVDEDFVCHDAVEFLPKQTVLLEIDAGQEPTTRLLERCQQLKQIGYEFSVSGITDVSAPVGQLLRLATYSKVDVGAVLPSGNLSSLLSRLRSSQTKLIANRVESVEEKQRCTDLGFDIFQGYYFAHPVIVEGRRLDASQQGLIRLINLTNDNADLAKIESAFKSEPGLAINLLRLTNSAGAGLSVRISSIRHAVTVVGLRQIQRWLTLLMFSHAGGSSNLTNNPLLQLAALRGCFMELLAYRCFPTKRDLRDPAFITGLMSFMPAALGMSMSDILSQISTTNDVRLALSRHEGDLGLMLELTERYDNEDIKGTADLLKRVGNKVTLQTLGLCLSETIAWVQQLGMEAD
ncbi:MAG: HDOD domain-containing protein [Sterolibacterium sp.]|jgi:EAL and modified HD-GYP domain-containing signal transduction protein